MTRFYVTDDGDEDQVSFVDRLTSRDMGARAPGVRPLGPDENFCDALILDRASGDYVRCFSRITYQTDQLGRLLAVCSRSGCSHKAVVPRRAPTEVPKVCPVCLNAITGENEGRTLRNHSFCNHCRRVKSARNRARRARRDRDNRRDQSSQDSAA
jgi:hypothetical protein